MPTRVAVQPRSELSWLIEPPPRGERFFSTETCLMLVVLAFFAAAHVYGASLIAASRAPVATVTILQGD